MTHGSTPPPTPPARGGACRTPPPPLAGGGRREGSNAADAALRLLDVLDRENAALAALDLSRAASMLAEKQAAVTGLTHACQGSAGADLARLAPRLNEAALRNRQLLERGIAVQGRVLAVVARAASRALAAQAPDRGAPRYGATGGAAPARVALALSLRA